MISKSCGNIKVSKLLMREIYAQVMLQRKLFRFSTIIALITKVTLDSNENVNHSQQQKQ